jgi:hemerythrin
MAYLTWDHELDTKIPVIDNQHRRIVEYINELHAAIEHGDRKQVGQVVEQLVDYTLSHFAFEEELMEQSGYMFLSAHKKVHNMFTRKVSEYQQRFELGEDIGRQLLTTLRTWLINHIRRDDADYAEIVRIAMEPGSHQKAGFLKRLFGG